MKNDWLAAENFERTHEVLSAINTLSIHAKLILAGVRDPAPDTDIERAKRRLGDFLGGLEAVLKEVEQQGEYPVVGTDPRLGELAMHFLSGRTRRTRPTHPATFDLAELGNLIRSEQFDDLRRLIPLLQDLRTLIEESVHVDVAGVLGDA